MGYLSTEKLIALGLKSLGEKVMISDKASIHDPADIEIGDYSRIDDFCVISGKVTLGRNVTLTVFCNIAGGELGVTLQDFSSLGYGCQVFSQSDDYLGYSLTNPTVPDKYKKEKKAAVLIMRHSIVGACSVIFPGVTLEEGTAVGAMSLVTKSTEPWSVYYGIPAKRQRSRNRHLLEMEKAYLQEGT